MSLEIVRDATTFDDEKRTGRVVLESDIETNPDQAMNELASVAAKTKALNYAASCGMIDPRINGNVGHCYPVNVDGKALTEVGVDPKTKKPYPRDHKKMKLHRYRIEVPVCKKLV